VPVFKDADEVYATIGKLLQDIAEDEDLAPKFRKANTIVRYEYRDPCGCRRASRVMSTSAIPTWSPR
jgi:hypothetical protein